jgi:hypothetical protein
VAGELLFRRDSLGFPVLLPFFDGQSGRSFYPLDRHHGPLARTGWVSLVAESLLLKHQLLLRNFLSDSFMHGLE